MVRGKRGTSGATTGKGSDRQRPRFQAEVELAGRRVKFADWHSPIVGSAIVRVSWLVGAGSRRCTLRRHGGGREAPRIVRARILVSASFLAAGVEGFCHASGRIGQLAPRRQSLSAPGRIGCPETMRTQHLGSLA